MVSLDSERRRWPSLLCLAVAGLMLVLGLTVLSPQLRGLGFVIYWLFCFLLTVAALVLAALELRSLQRRVRAAQRELIKQTLEHSPEDDSEDTDGPARS